MSSLSTSDCLTILGLDKPRFSGKSQEEVDAKVAVWKAEVLKPAYHAKAHEVHPDKHGDDPVYHEKLRLVREAYQQLQKLEVRLKKPENRCPDGHERIPVGAKYCHECGYCYVEDPLVSRLKAAGILPHTIEHIRANGEFDRMKSLPAFSPLPRSCRSRSRSCSTGSGSASSALTVDGDKRWP